MTFSELNRERRGHSFLTEEIEATLPALYSTELLPMLDKDVHLHFFASGLDWWVFEYDPAEERAFAFVNLNSEDSAEAGYVYLPEIESLLLKVPMSVNGIFSTFELVVERDLNWVVKPAAQAIPAQFHRSWWER